MRIPAGQFSKQAFSILPDYSTTSSQVHIPLSAEQYDRVLKLEQPLQKMLSRATGAARGLASGAGQGLAGGLLGTLPMAALGVPPAIIPLGTGFTTMFGAGQGMLEGFSRGPEMAKHQLIRGLDKTNRAELVMRHEEQLKLHNKALQAAQEANEQVARLVGMAEDAVGTAKKYAPWMLLGGAGAWGLEKLLSSGQKQASVKTAAPQDSAMDYVKPVVTGLFGLPGFFGAPAWQASEAPAGKRFSHYMGGMGRNLRGSIVGSIPGVIAGGALGGPMGALGTGIGTSLIGQGIDMAGGIRKARAERLAEQAALRLRGQAMLAGLAGLGGLGALGSYALYNSLTGSEAEDQAAPAEA